jgi:hypothetical protein
LIELRDAVSKMANLDIRVTYLDRFRLGPRS